MIDLPENELLQRARAGDDSAENEIIRRYEPVAAKCAVKYGRFGYAPDVAQAARIGTMRAIRRHRSDLGTRLSTTVRQWAYGYAMHTRDRERDAATMCAGPAGEEPQDLGASPDEAYAARQLSERVAALVEGCREMDAHDRTIFSERILGEKFRPELAKEMGLSVSAIRLREIRLREEVLPRLLSPLR